MEPDTAFGLDATGGLVGWGERQIWRGEGSEEWPDGTGQLATQVQGYAWAWAVIKGQVLLSGPGTAQWACVDACGFCHHWGPHKSL